MIRNRVGEVIQERGLTIAEVARRMGRDPAQIQRLMKEDANPTIRTVHRLCVATGASTEELFPADAA